MSALAVYAICLAVYALTCGSAIGWLDSPELVAAGSQLGVPHSPGHPLVAMLGKIASLLPIGDIPFRIALASAVAASGAATALFYATRIVVTAITGTGKLGKSAAVDGVALGTALTFAFAWAMWFQGVRVEVYALEALLVIAALGLALAYRRDRHPRFLIAFAFVGGLAATNHPAIAATVLMPCTAMVVVGTSIRRLGMAAAGAALSLLAVAYLPIRAAAGPALNWGDPSTLSRLVWTLSGRAFHKTASASRTSSFGEDWTQVTVAVAEAATIPLALLALVGLYLGLRQHRARTMTLVLFAVLVVAILGRVVLGFDAETPDHHAYVVAAIVATMLLAVIAIATLANMLEDRGAPSALALPSAALALVLLAGVQLASNWERSSLAGARASDQLISQTTAELPPRALLLSAYFETRFQLYAARAVFGARPDVTVLDRSFLTYPGAAGHESALHPELRELIEAPLKAGSPTPTAKLDAISESRPVLAELHPNVDGALKRRLAPLGAFALYTAEPSAALRSRIEAADAVAVKRLEQTSNTDVPFDAERAMLSFIWREYFRMELYCELGRREAAATTHARLVALIPQDQSLAELASRCLGGGR